MKYRLVVDFHKTGYPYVVKLGEKVVVSSFDAVSVIENLISKINQLKGEENNHDLR